ncbi:hypothetical protein LCGC14_0958770 [marine sediment metagenome]|uniref:Uncharacterized protein n=1 Tax=marine sediment metagenome TaxID=412755 RepID=A0A0F9P170_9ZZZZ|nr:hypothetical protein [archaeon]
MYANIRNRFKRIYDKITQPKVVKISVYISLLSFLPGLLIGIAVAMNYGPIGYSLWFNYISDLGSKLYTPAPFILDITVIITSIFTVPLILNMSRLYSSEMSDNIDNSKKIHYINLFRRIFGYSGVVSLILGVIGMFNIGIFSLDRSPMVHYFFAVLTFAGFAFGSFFTGLAIVLKKKIFPRSIGFFMVFGPPVASILFLINPQPLTREFLEWVMTFMALAWYYPLVFITLQKINTLLFFKSGY